MVGQIESFIFKPSEAIFALSFLHNFGTACDSNVLHEGSAMSLFLHFMKEEAKAALSYPTGATEGDKINEEWKLTTYFQTVSFLFGTCAPDDIVEEAGDEIMSYVLPENMSTVWYSENRLERH